MTRGCAGSYADKSTSLSSSTHDVECWMMFLGAQLGSDPLFRMSLDVHKTGNMSTDGVFARISMRRSTTSTDKMCDACGFG